MGTFDKPRYVNVYATPQGQVRLSAGHFTREQRDARRQADGYLYAINVYPRYARGDLIQTIHAAGTWQIVDPHVRMPSGTVYVIVRPWDAVARDLRIHEIRVQRREIHCRVGHWPLGHKPIGTPKADTPSEPDAPRIGDTVEVWGGWTGVVVGQQERIVWVSRESNETRKMTHYEVKGGSRSATILVRADEINKVTRRAPAMTVHGLGTANPTTRHMSGDSTLHVTPQVYSPSLAKVVDTEVRKIINEGDDT
jgi:hypothetical protein